MGQVKYDYFTRKVWATRDTGVIAGELARVSGFDVIHIDYWFE